MIALTPFNPEWGFVCGRISTLESRLLSSDFIQTLVSHPKLEDMMRQLQDTPLREFVGPGADWQDWSGIIDQYFHDLVKSIRSDCPNPAVPSIFILRDDYQNLKLAVTEQQAFPFPGATLDTEVLAATAGGDPSSLPSPFRETAVAALAVVAETRSHQMVDVILDAAYLRHIMELSSTSVSPLVRAYMEDMVLARSLVMLWRRIKAGTNLRTIQQYMLPMGSLTSVLNGVLASGDPATWADIVRGHMGEVLRQTFEEGSDGAAQRFQDLAANHLATLARRGQGQVSGPERVLSYIRTLASEAHNLKLIVCGRLSRIDATVLKRRMRVSYV